jgi:hypothetical protein
MRQFAANIDDFLGTCTNLIERMINTVPSFVKLTDPITPNPVKPVNIELQVADDGSLLFSGDIRVSYHSLLHEPTFHELTSFWEMVPLQIDRFDSTINLRRLTTQVRTSFPLQQIRLKSDSHSTLLFNSSRSAIILLLLAVSNLSL